MDRKEAMRRESHKNSGKVMIVAIRGDSEKIGGKKSVHKLGGYRKSLSLEPQN